MSEEQPVPPEKWAMNFRVAGLSDESSAWDVARAWVSEGLVEWGNGTDDPEKVLREILAAEAMNKDEIRALIREEIRAAFEAARLNADFRLYHEDHAISAAADAVVGAMGAALESLTPAEPADVPLDGLMEQVTGAQVSPVQLSGRPSVSDPEPVNPFAPKRTAQQWADEIKAVIQRALDDGHLVWIENKCCGCSSEKLAMRIGAVDSDLFEDPIVWGGPHGN